MLIMAEGFEGFVNNRHMVSVHRLHPSITALGVLDVVGTYSFIPGRHGGLAFGRNSNMGFSGFHVKIDPKQSHLFVSFAYLDNAITTNEWEILSFYDTHIYHHARLSYNQGTKTLLFKRLGNPESVMLSVSNFVDEGNWTWICLEYLVHGSSGRAVLYDGNGNVVASYTGRTTNHSSNVIDTVALVSGPYAFYDDLIINDPISPGPNNPYFFKHVPDTQIKQVLPIGTGDITEFSPVGAPTVWEALDDYPYSNLDTDYARTNAADSRFLVRPGPTDMTEIRGVVVTNTIRRDGSNLWRTSNLLKPDPGSLQIYESALTNLPMPDTYFKDSTLWLVNPDTNTAWTKEYLRNTQVGIRAIAL